MKKYLLHICLVLLVATTAWAVDTRPEITGIPTGCTTDCTFTSISSSTITADTLTLGAGSLGSPSLMMGDTNSGLYGGDNMVSLVINGTDMGTFTVDGLRGKSVAGRPFILLNEEASTTNPIYGYFQDPDSGLGRYAAGYPSMISDGTEVVRFHNQTTTFYPSGVTTKISDTGELITTGSRRYHFTNVTSASFPVDNHEILKITASNKAITLPLVDCTSTLAGRAYTMVAFDVTSSITLDPASGDSIHDGATDANYTGLDTTREANDFICDGADNWIVK